MHHLLLVILQVYKGKDGNGPKVAVAGLSLAIHKKECFGLLGPNGAGKTTTIKVCSALSTDQKLDFTANSCPVWRCPASMHQFNPGWTASVLPG